MARKTIQRHSDPLFPEHPLEEHQWRLERTRKIMRDDGLDALVSLRNVNVLYYTGTRFVFANKEAPVVVAPQSAAIITQDADIYCQRFGPFDTDAVPLHTAVSRSIECYDTEFELVNVLRDYGIGDGHRVGTEWRNILAGMLDALRQRADVVLVDSTPLLAGDALATSAAVDAIVVVVHMDVVRRPMLREMRRVLDSIPTRKIGFVAAGEALGAYYSINVMDFRGSTRSREPVA